MHILKLDTHEPRQVRKFIRFPRQLYRDCPQFCPALESASRLALDREKHPFYRHSTADFFLAEADGEVLGRIAAVHNRMHNDYRKVRTAFFSDFDCVEDEQVARALFEAAIDWARGRGCDTLLGPRGLVGSDAAGVLVEGFDRRAGMGIPFNFPYYDGFIRRMGFEKLTDHWSGYLAVDLELPARLLEVAEKVQVRRGYRVLHFTSRDELRRWAPRALAVHEQAFAGSHEWHPNTAEELDLIVADLIGAADPRLIKLVLKGEQVVGFALVYPDLSDGLRRGRGRLLPFGWLHLLRAARKTDWLLANGVGMLPAYQNLGGNAVLYSEVWKAVQALGRYRHVEVVEVNETNFTSRSDMERLGVKWVKKHRSYTRRI